MRGVTHTLLLLAIAAAGCTRDETRVVTLWHQMRPGDRAVLGERTAQFERENPGVEVRAVYKETEQLRSGLESAVLVGEGPDVVYGPSDTLGVYQAIGALVDLSPWFSERATAEFDPRALVRMPPGPQGRGDPEQLVMVGDRFGNHLALVYNRKFIPTPPATTDELVRQAVANTVDEDGDGRNERYGLVWNYTEPFFVIPFLTGYGAWVFDEGSTTANGRPVPALDTPESIAAYRFVRELQTVHQVLPLSADYEAAAALFRSGKAAMIIDGDWSWNGYLAEEGVDAAVAPLPVVSETGIPMGPMVSPKGYSMSIAARGDQRALAAELIRFLTSEETQREFLVKQKILPSRVALRESPLVTDDPTLIASLQQLENGRLMPVSTEMRAVWDAMRPPYQQLMSGSADAPTAARQMQRDAVRRIDTLTTAVEPGAAAPFVTAVGIAAVVGMLIWQRRAFVDLARDLPRNRLAYALALPAIGLIFLTVLFPLAYNVMLSFSNMSLTNFRDWRIVGVQNYVSLFVGEGSAKFWGVFLKTVVWTAVNVALHVVLGVMLAVVINGPVRGKTIYRVLLIIPWAVPQYITALTWRGMFDYEFGAVNHALGAVGLPAVEWLTEANTAFAACIITNVWLGFPFMMIVALGGLQGIPHELYEAAQIDRATRWQQFWHITVPMLRPVLLPAVTLGAVWTFNNLNVVWLVSNGGEPADQTHILVSYVYKSVFNLYQYGYGAALSMVIFFILLSFSVVFLSRTKASEAVA